MANTLSTVQGGPAVIELRANLLTEQTRAKGVETANCAATSTEETCAKSVEVSILLQVESTKASLAGEISRAVGADSVLDRRITG